MHAGPEIITLQLITIYMVRTHSLTASYYLLYYYYLLVWLDKKETLFANSQMRKPCSSSNKNADEDLDKNVAS